MFGSVREQDGLVGRPMNVAKSCPDCRTLIGSSVANEPHVSLRTETTAAVGPDPSYLYKCRACDSRLLRERKMADPNSRWRLF